MMVLQPLENIHQSLVEKSLDPMSFNEKKEREKLRISWLSWKQTETDVSILYQSLHRKSPPKSSFNDDEASLQHIFLAAPKQ